MIAVPDADETRAVAPRELQCGLHRPCADDGTETVVAVDEGRRRTRRDQPDVGPRLDHAGLDAPRVHRQPHQAVRIHAAQFRLDQAAGDVAGVRRRNVEALQDTAAVLEQVLVPVAA